MPVSNQVKQIQQHLLASLCLALYRLRNQKTFNPLFRRYWWSLFFSWAHAQYQPSHSYVITIKIHMDMGARYASFLVAHVPHKPSSFIAPVTFLFNSWISATSSFRLDCDHNPGMIQSSCCTKTRYKIMHPLWRTIQLASNGQAMDQSSGTKPTSNLKNSTVMWFPLKNSIPWRASNGKWTTQCSQGRSTPWALGAAWSQQGGTPKL